MCTPCLQLIRVLISSLLLLLTAHAATATTGSNSDFGNSDFSLAISGGISIGAYEAGLNWAIVNYQKTNSASNFRSITGASAGAINALLSAISWCVDDKLAAEHREAINRIMATADQGFNTVNNNLLRDVWLQVGFDALLPEDQDDNSQYMHEDALLSRYAFRAAINKVIKISRLKIFSDCNIPMGLVVTRVTPLALKVKNVQINTTRMVIPLLVRAGRDHHLEFHSLLLPDTEKRFGSVIYLPSLDNSVGRQKTHPKQPSLYPVGIKSVITAVLTSSAFPVAFGRINLAHCQPPEYGDLTVNLEPQHFSHHALNYFQSDELGPLQYYCPQGMVLSKAEFVDGGAFDNLPVGLSTHLNEMEFGDTPRYRTTTENRVLYYYMDPNNLRPEGQKDSSKVALGFTYDTQIMSFDLVEQIRFFFGSSKASSDYELYNSFRWDPIPKDDLYLTTRYGPLTGKYWAHFGAFIDYAFREYDYYVGVYDGIVALSEQMCATFGSAKQTVVADAFQLCIIGHFFQIYQQLNPAKDPMMAYMIRLLTSYETGAREVAGSDAANLLTRLPGPECLHRENEQRCQMTPAQRKQLDKLTLIHQGLTRVTGQQSKAGQASNESIRQAAFTDFINYLHDNGYPRKNNESTLNYILANVNRDPTTWYRPLVNRASHRLIKLENSELYRQYQPRNNSGIMHPSAATTAPATPIRQANAANDDNPRPETDFNVLKPVAKFGVFLSALTANTMVGTNKDFSLSQSSAPSPGAWVLAPYEIGIDVRNGGMVGSWEPSWNVAGKHFLNLKLMPYDNNRYGEYDVHMSQVELIYKYRTGFGISSIGIAPTWNHTYKDWGGETRRNNLGLAVHIGLLADKLRFSIARRSFDSDYFPGDNFYMTLSLTDVQGLVYWLHKTYTSSPGVVRNPDDDYFP